MKNTPILASVSILPILLAFSSLAALAGQPVAEKKVITPVETTDYPVHPISAPYWAEDSFIGTDFRPVFAYHHFPGEIFGGGRALVYAAQLRVKLTDSLQIVAYKDGYTDMELKGYNDQGWNDLAAGIKWAFLQNESLNLHVAAGVGYEFASGDDQVLQDDDGVRLWLSANKGFGKLHLGATVNYFLATDNGDDGFGDSNSLSWHLHADYQLCNWFSPVIEINGYHVTDEGDVVTPFGGSDVLNLGGNKNEDTITLAVGAEIRPCSKFAFRAAWETPLTDNVDFWGHRWTFSSVITF